ncbi:MULTISPECIES: tetratricopeptide repeat protein [Leptolyngbya]|uniref:tetratricopeptide repeat protein n=1 Tax=Leptolyngbya TaxID=47251 RepID=UPI000361AD01|nr:tetratricopeptide repeat protein [Leptolyngbya boryana]MBD2398549.1 tetratricopeptide repeat protein [Leptolyngbya sp. FACHB-239]MBD2406251.1 tetratricopeptide repeat protein [Leptolyngbya sp. FACHB-402]ULP30702.1 tetratricopeptide repeat protein [Leptolyngbya boryana IU 594]
MGREDELVRLQEILRSSSSAAIAVVSGMGGLGKTQLAAKYATENKAKYPGGIYWLNGRASNLAVQIIYKAEFDLHLPGLDAAKERLQESAAIAKWCWDHWLPKEPTLIVVDDVADWAEVRSLMPVESRFRVLVTTRQRDLLPQQHTIALKRLEPEQSRSLLAALEEVGRVEDDRAFADRICAGLGNLPLAIELVGSYLRHDRHLTLSEIWERLRSNGVRDEVLERSPQYEMAAELGVRAAFDLTWETIEPEGKRVARLLSYFGLDWVPWELAERVMQRVEGEEYRFGKWKARLENASLVEFEPERIGDCRLHPLIQSFLRDQPEEEEIRSAFVKEMIAIAKTMPDNPTTKQVNQFKGLELHVQEISKRHIAELEEDDLLWAFVGLARFYEGQALFRDAESQYADCLAVTQRLFEGDLGMVALSLNNLAALYDSQGRLSEAEPLYLQALQMTQRLFEGDHPNIALSLNNLAYLYKAQGRLSEAEPLYLQALQMTQRLFEGDHPDVARSLNNLALLYQTQGRLSEAEPLYLQALQMTQRLFEGDHPDVARSLNNLALLYQTQGRLSEAEPLYLQALDMRKRLFEGDHPDVARSLNNLALLYKAQGQLSEAEPLYLQALDMRKRLFEGDHPDVAKSLNNLAGLYKAQGKLEQAEIYYQQALQLCEKFLGANHPDTQIVRNNLAYLRQQQQSIPPTTSSRSAFRRLLRPLRRFIRFLLGCFGIRSTR